MDALECSTRPPRRPSCSRVDWSPDGREILVLFSSTAVVGSGPRKEQLATVFRGRGECPDHRVLGESHAYDTVGGWIGFSPDGRSSSTPIHPGRRGVGEGRATSSPGTTVTRLVSWITPPTTWRRAGARTGRASCSSSDRTGTLDLWMLPVGREEDAGEARLVKPGIGRMVFPGIRRGRALLLRQLTRVAGHLRCDLDPRTGRVAVRPDATHQALRRPERLAVLLAGREVHHVRDRRAAR